MANMIVKPPTGNKFIITGSDDEYDKYSEKVYELDDRLQNSIMEAESRLSGDDDDEHVFRMPDGNMWTGEEVLNYLTGDEHLNVQCSVEDAINWCGDVISKHCIISTDDLRLVCEFIRCFGN